jgi:hypothetical protein
MTPLHKIIIAAVLLLLAIGATAYDFYADIEKLKRDLDGTNQD